MKNKKYFYLFIGCLILILSSLVFYQTGIILQGNSEIQLQKNIITSQSALLTPKPIPTVSEMYYLSKQFYSPNRLFSASLRHDGKTDTYSFKIVPQSFEYKVDMGNDIWQEKLKNFESPVRYLDIIAWSNNGLSAAILLPEKIMLYLFTMDDNTLTKKGVEFIKIPTSEKEGMRKLFFSGDDTMLYVISNKNIYEYSFSNKKLVLLSDLKSYGNIYPIPHSPGFIRWGEKLIEKSGYDYRLVSYGLKPGIDSHVPAAPGTIDYPGEIYLSPGFDKACFNAGASGSRWATVFNLNSEKFHYVGPSYSKCKRWIDNNQMIIEENNYFDQKTFLYFIINTLTGEKTFLFDQYIFNN